MKTLVLPFEAIDVEFLNLYLSRGRSLKEPLRPRSFLLPSFSRGYFEKRDGIIKQQLDP